MTPASSTPGRRRRPIGAALALLACLVAVAASTAPAGAGVPHKNGTYNGSTRQAAVSPAFRGLSFKVRTKKIELTAEPVVQLGLCVSTPVFTLDGTPTKKISGRGTFTFTHTFMGNKFDKIHGRFVSTTEIEGYAIYHFNAQDLCSGGKSKVNFTAART